MVHLPVMLEAALGGLALVPGGVYLDCTFGRGGHSRAMLERLGPEGRLVALDKDPDAVASAEAERLRRDPRFTLVQADFRDLGAVVREAGLCGRVAGMLLDLGVSSPQLDTAARGFAFLQEGPLDMRMNPTVGLSAAEWLAQADERELADVIHRYGEERYARRIARAIVRARVEAPLRTTRQLAELVERAVPRRERHKHPATRTFQAIRIHVNRELEALEAALAQSLEVLAPGGRLVVIAFHSLEDRIVKRFIRRHSRPAPLPRKLPVAVSEPDLPLRDLGKRRPDALEIARNPRARSAVLRVAERR
ncbi:16S rRNA (cytosine1402-N4)-methyltransferase [Methylomarinovum tepidoasis]|uniref:Ribosomal RNA small subunit methyltransferase H n=1 Tax=Methylomarinovum tepidoasis TaxID=2840183 RepID=A0AAU9CCP3_9GAMM|nr:16S rRNA (cytosine(1402)-N(4))-methyltransferase RsmH [Methylomarinovum sp. IN45]BCX88028.1 16S rRNA (cytosine1402-N4)-methyltransferase [Methylomarinovum sp. IN45]